MAHNSARQRQIPHDLAALLPTARGFFDSVGHRRTATFKDFREKLNIAVEIANGLVHELLAEGYIERAGGQGYRKTPPLKLAGPREARIPEPPEIPFLPGVFHYAVCETLQSFPEGLSANDVAELTGDRSRYNAVMSLLHSLEEQGYVIHDLARKRVFWRWTPWDRTTTIEWNQRRLKVQRAEMRNKLEKQRDLLRKDLDKLYSRVARKSNDLDAVQRKLNELE